MQPSLVRAEHSSAGAHLIGHSGKVGRSLLGKGVHHAGPALQGLELDPQAASLRLWAHACWSQAGPTPAQGMRQPRMPGVPSPQPSVQHCQGSAIHVSLHSAGYCT